MRRATIDEVKTQLPALLLEVERGDEVVIIDHDKPIARLVPVEMPSRRPVFGSARAAMERSGLTYESMHKALAPLGEDDLDDWGIV